MVKRKQKPRKGFTRSKKEWEESITTHIGKFIDRMSVTDIINASALGFLTYATYKGINTLAEEGAPWWTYIQPLWWLAPVLNLTSKSVQGMNPGDRLVLSFITAYGALKLPGVISGLGTALATLE